MFTAKTKEQLELDQIIRQQIADRHQLRRGALRVMTVTDLRCRAVVGVQVETNTYCPGLGDGQSG